MGLHIRIADRVLFLVATAVWWGKRFSLRMRGQATPLAWPVPWPLCMFTPSRPFWCTWTSVVSPLLHHAWLQVMPFARPLRCMLSCMSRSSDNTTVLVLFVPSPLPACASGVGLLPADVESVQAALIPYTSLETFMCAGNYTGRHPCFCLGKNCDTNELVDGQRCGCSFIFCPLFLLAVAVCGGCRQRPWSHWLDPVYCLAAQAAPPGPVWHLSGRRWHGVHRALSCSHAWSADPQPRTCVHCRGSTSTPLCCRMGVRWVPSTGKPC
jgi:hypothetical protein